MLRNICLIALSPAGSAWANEAPVYQPEQLLAKPAAYNGQTVTVGGYLSWEFESHSLCPTPQKHFAPEKCLWTGSTADKAAPRFQAANGTLTLVTGKFNPDKHGHLGLWPATLDNAYPSPIRPSPPGV